MKHLAIAALTGLCVYTLAVIFCVVIEAIGVWAYGWDSTGEGYLFGAVVLGPVVAIFAGAYAWSGAIHK